MDKRLIITFLVGTRNVEFRFRCWLFIAVHRKGEKYHVMMLELAAGILVDFLAAGGRLRAWPGLRWAMVGDGGPLVGAWWQRRMRRRPTRDPATCQPGGSHPSKLLGFVSTCTHWILSIDPSLGIQPKYETFFLNLCLSIQTKSRVS